MSRADYMLGLEVGQGMAAATYRAQVEELERLWLAAEHDADHWYFEANNPEEARAQRAALSSTASIDAQSARAQTEWGPVYAGHVERKAS